MITPGDLADLVPRHLAERVETTLRTTRVINIVGPRQTGKTTLVRDMIEAAHFLDLDDEGHRFSVSRKAIREGSKRLLEYVKIRYYGLAKYSIMDEQNYLLARADGSARCWTRRFRAARPTDAALGMDQWHFHPDPCSTVRAKHEQWPRSPKGGSRERVRPRESGAGRSARSFRITPERVDNAWWRFAPSRRDGNDGRADRRDHRASNRRHWRQRTHRGTWEVDRRSLAVALTVMEGLMPGLTLTGVCQVFDRRTNWKAF